MLSRLPLLLTPLFVLDDCGPTATEAATAGLASVPVGFAGTGLLLWLLIVLWRRFVEPTPADWAGWWRVCGALCFVGLGALVVGPPVEADYVVMGSLILGNFQLLYGALAWRLWRVRPNAVWVGPTIVAEFACLVALLMWLSGKTAFIEVWTYGSSDFPAGLLIYGLLLSEIAARGARRHWGAPTPERSTSNSPGVRTDAASNVP